MNNIISSRCHVQYPRPNCPRLSLAKVIVTHVYFPRSARVAVTTCILKLSLPFCFFCQLFNKLYIVFYYSTQSKHYNRKMSITILHFFNNSNCRTISSINLAGPGPPAVLLLLPALLFQHLFFYYNTPYYVCVHVRIGGTPAYHNNTISETK